MAHESSIDCEVDGKTEEMSMDSEMIHQSIGNDGVFETKIEKDENQVDNWLKSINRGKRNGTNTIPNFTPSPLPALDIAQAQAQARSQKKAQTVKLSDDLTTTAEFALLQPKIIAETPIASTSIQPTTPAPRNRRPSSHPRSAVVGGKRRGRPPKTAEVRAAEAAVKLENKRIAEANRRAAIKAATAAAKAAQAEADAQADAQAEAEADAQAEAQAKAEADAQAKAQAEAEAQAQTQTDRMPVVAQVDIESSASIVTLGESSQAAVDSNPSTPAYSLAGTPTLRRRRRSKPDSSGPLPTVQTPLSNLTQNPSSNLFTRPSPNVIKIKPLSRSVSQPVDPSLLSGSTSHVLPLPIQQLPSGYAIPTHSRPPSVNHHNQTYEQRPTSASRLESPHHHSSSHRLPQATLSEPRLSAPSSLSNILNPAPSRPVHDSNLHQRPQPRYGSTEASITNFQLPSHHHQHHQQQQLTPSAASRTSSRPGSSTGGNQLFNHHSSPRSPHLSPSIINNNISFHHSHSTPHEHSIISNSFTLSPHRPSGSLTSNSIIQDHHSTTSSSS
ncbi:hypothetical protein CROQUDRAFT_442139 [Cronartium quercuum f. sp. fusiforme G11]|uniref:Uncharacterized protein n=1 Tax=Cronartium quercuum f. sp. fusiforme G11 TaxID=708437 RepID=A0A9P6N5F5_9BASI|nr:hypothetical protein CROQUDRAFT_442139 [Cronartium quercuum f. sp. fusiforme G11]